MHQCESGAKQKFIKKINRKKIKHPLCTANAAGKTPHPYLYKCGFFPVLLLFVNQCVCVNFPSTSSECSRPLKDFTSEFFFLRVRRRRWWWRGRICCKSSKLMWATPQTMTEDEEGLWGLSFPSPTLLVNDTNSWRHFRRRCGMCNAVAFSWKISPGEWTRKSNN